MLRSLGVVCAIVALACPAVVTAGDLKGDYMETRTCDVYTGPCYANGQAGLMGRDAIMAWNIERGSYGGVSLAGLKVVVVLHASDTLGFGGPFALDPNPINSVIIVDEKATPEQEEMLVQFAIEHGQHTGEVAKVLSAPINMTVDHFAAVGDMKAGSYAKLLTRKLNEGDCVCHNETAFFPPLCTVKNANPAYTVDGEFSGPGLKTQWSNPYTRTAYLASFSY